MEDSDQSTVVMPGFTLALFSPGVELDVFLGQESAVQQEENSLGGDADSLHQRGDSFFHASLQISLKLDEFLTIFQIKDKKRVSGGLSVTLVWSGISPSFQAISSKFLLSVPLINSFEKDLTQSRLLQWRFILTLPFYLHLFLILSCSSFIFHFLRDFFENSTPQIYLYNI